MGRVQNQNKSLGQTRYKGKCIKLYRPWFSPQWVKTISEGAFLFFFIRLNFWKIIHQFSNYLSMNVKFCEFQAFSSHCASLLFSALTVSFLSVLALLRYILVQQLARLNSLVMVISLGNGIFFSRKKKWRIKKNFNIFIDQESFNFRLVVPVVF